MSEGFLGRWSRRKHEVRVGEVPDEPVVPRAPVASGPTPATLPTRTVGPQPVSDPPAETFAAAEDPAPAPLTLDDARALTLDSDFRPFVARHVAPDVKNAAFKKLFADPHFNVMDGLDTYIDDYSIPSPLPESVLRQMASAKFLKLFDEDPEPADASAAAQETLADEAPPDVAQSQPPENVPSPPIAEPAQAASQETDDHHADLRLQPDDAARAESARGDPG